MVTIAFPSLSQSIKTLLINP